MSVVKPKNDNLPALWNMNHQFKKPGLRQELELLFFITKQ